MCGKFLARVSEIENLIENRNRFEHEIQLMSFQECNPMSDRPMTLRFAQLQDLILCFSGQKANQCGMIHSCASHCLTSELLI